MDKNNIISGLSNNISNSQVIQEPFVHQFIEKIFPEDFYLQLLENIPNVSEFTAINKTGTVGKDYPDERFVFNYTDQKDTEKLSESQKLFFNELRYIMSSADLFKVVTSIFKETLDKSIASLRDDPKRHLDTSNLKFTLRTSLIKDYTKYSLGAHTDSISKFVTFLFYIPTNEDLKENGTSLYKPLISPQDSTHFNMEDTKKNFQKVKTCPFIPNSVLIFPRTSTSFHGVEEVNIDQKERNLLLLNYYINF